MSSLGWTVGIDGEKTSNSVCSISSIDTHEVMTAMMLLASTCTWLYTGRQSAVSGVVKSSQQE